MTDDSPTPTARSGPVSEDAKQMALRISKVLLDALTTVRTPETMRLIGDVTRALTQ